MQLVIIAGGLGRRLRPLTLTRPKALIPLVDRPMVVHLPGKDEIASHLVNAGRYVFEPRVFDFIEAGHPVSLEREVFPRLIGEGLTPYRFDGWWSDAGTLSNYLNAQRLLLAASRAKI